MGSAETRVTKVRSSGSLLTRGDRILKNPEKTDQHHVHRADILSLEHASESPVRSVEIQVSGPTPRISDLVGQNRSIRFAFLEISLVILMVQSRDHTLTETGIQHHMLMHTTDIP